MKKKIIISLCLLSSGLAQARGSSGHAYLSSSVSGYTKSNGTYVAPSHRTSADSIKSNNWSTKGNINPYTGKLGTKNK